MTPVDRYRSGTSPYGVYDMCGDVWEWCADETSRSRHELKGSAFTSSFVRAAPSMFNDAIAEMLDDDTGFRCVSPFSVNSAQPAERRWVSQSLPPTGTGQQRAGLT